ncbi:MAG: toll/interleukin-1 receptor domain-containing protein [Clostridia bacterium]|nr:toll/interleukin-1 receptor domain-containing protein [Clostridia bacterium]
MESRIGFVKTYIDKLENLIIEYANVENFNSEWYVDTIYTYLKEICHVFNNEFPDLNQIISWKSQDALFDLKTVLAKLKYFVILESEKQHSVNKGEVLVQNTEQERKRVFISHRTSDSGFAKILERFLMNCGVAHENIFVSSLPGNDVAFEIAKEVKENIKNSVLNIVLLSSSYYESAYCQNEAGIIWYLDTTKVIFALSDVTEKNMQGFLNNEHKIRRLIERNDLLFLAEKVKELFASDDVSPVALNAFVEDAVASALTEIERLKQKENNNVLQKTSDGYYVTTVLEERYTGNTRFRCVRINGLLPVNQPYKSDETHWLLFDSSLYKELKEGSKIKFRPSSIKDLRDFNDIKNTRNIYIKHLEVLI